LTPGRGANSDTADVVVEAQPEAKSRTEAAATVNFTKDMTNLTVPVFDGTNLKGGSAGPKAWCRSLSESYATRVRA
jgi:hypothetical protein